MAERERETIIHTDGGERRGGGGTLLAVVLLIAILIVGFLLYRNGTFGGAGGDDVNVKVEVPGTGGGSGG